MSWPLASLGEVAPSKPLKNPEILDENSVWQLNLDKVESHSGLVTEKVYGSVQSAGSSTHWFDERHVLYSKLRPYLNKVVLPEEQGLATTELVPLYPDKDRLDRKYLTYYLRSNRFVKWISDQVAGAKMPRVSMKVFWEHQIPLPPLDEQKRIAAILDKADAIRRKCQQAIDLADDFRRSAFIERFGDPRNSSFPIRELQEVCTKITDGTHHTPTYTDSGVHFLRVTDINKAKVNWNNTKFVSKEEHLDLIKRCHPEKGDVLYSKNGTIGVPRLIDWDTEFSIFVSLCLIKLKKELLLGGYLESFLKTPFALKQATARAKSATVTNLHLVEIKEIKLPVPPLDVQREWLDFVSNHKDMMTKLEHSMNEANNQFNSISQQAFLGEL